MSVVLLHELLYPKEVRPVLEPVQGGDPDLLIKRENFLGHPGFDMEKCPDTPQKITGLRH
jgi:hypothetical protein